MYSHHSNQPSAKVTTTLRAMPSPSILKKNRRFKRAGPQTTFTQGEDGLAIMVVLVVGMTVWYGEKKTTANTTIWCEGRLREVR